MRKERQKNHDKGIEAIERGSINSNTTIAVDRLRRERVMLSDVEKNDDDDDSSEGEERRDGEMRWHTTRLTWYYNPVLCCAAV